jgi:hypothetical protein
MKLFEKVSGGNRRNLIGEKLNSAASKVQAGWAQSMERLTAGMNRKGWIIAMLCLILCIGGYSSYLIIHAFTGQPSVPLKNAQIKKPEYSNRTGEPKAIAKITEAEYERIVKFHKYMDSLAAEPSGNATYKNIMAQRPGLLDSIKQVEQYYQQLKEK